jgi:hypothetical protein
MGQVYFTKNATTATMRMTHRTMVEVRMVGPLGEPSQNEGDLGVVVSGGAEDGA